MDPYQHADDPADARLPEDEAGEAPTWQDVLAVGGLAARLAGDGPDQAYAALAHMVRNRMRAARASDIRFGDGTWTGALRGLAPGPDSPPPRGDRLTRSQLRAIARACRVAAGEEGDITRGATLCHRHDEAPRWARTAEATALIGDLIFYRTPG